MQWKYFEMIKPYSDLASFYVKKDKTKMIVKNMEWQKKENLQEEMGIKEGGRVN